MGNGTAEEQGINRQDAKDAKTIEAGPDTGLAGRVPP
jgi:hypothetical protein